MPPQPPVFLVTPVYNQAEFIAESVRSVLAQTYSAIRYSVVDDGSTDGTAAVVAALGAPLTLIRQPNRGQAATMNAAWRASDEPLLGYLSGDDLLLPDAVAACAAVLAEDAGAVCAFPDCDLIAQDGRLITSGAGRPFDPVDAALRHRCFIGPGAIFRAEAFRVAGGWREDLRLHADREFWIRLSALGRIRFVPRRLAAYRMHPAATSRRPDPAALLHELDLITDAVFASPGRPAALGGRRREARAHARMLAARAALRRGSPATAAGLALQACREHPPVAAPWAMAGYAASILRNQTRSGMGRLSGGL